MSVDPYRRVAGLGTRRARRVLLWAALVVLLLVAQSLLVWLTLGYEETRAQDRADEAAAAAAAEVRRRSQVLLQRLLSLPQRRSADDRWAEHAAVLLREHRELARLERRDRELHTVEQLDSPISGSLFQRWPRREMDADVAAACASAARLATPVFSRSQFVPLPEGLGLEVSDVCIPSQDGGQAAGFTVATVVLATLLQEAHGPPGAPGYEWSFVEADGTRLARSGLARGSGVFVAVRVVDLPGVTLQLRLDAVERRPSLIPNLATALVLSLSLGLFAVVLLLVRDARRRARAEAALAEALAFRKAMEDSLITGLRARDRAGRIVYVNRAFCAMVGFDAETLLVADLPPYWPPEQVPTYLQRQAERLAPGKAGDVSREGFETEFMRAGGERFPVMIYEAPLVDGGGRHTGWMSAVLDVSAQRRAEDLSRQQQERLQATARLASVGEMASLLSHELNQPLSAIASYAHGSLNLLALPDGQTEALIRQALARIAEQAERAGRVIRSVHDFVRRGQQMHEVIAADLLIESVLPLVRLQARKCGARIEIDIPAPVPQVRVDRTMVEQVLLNLARNGVQAMESDTPLAERVLTLRVRLVQGRWVAFSVLDAGPGIPADVAQQLFKPFFTTRAEGMGLGLSLCRTVVEQHGGAIDFAHRGPAGSPRGTEFRFTLPLVADPGRWPPGPGAAPY
jgi:two-component system, LuxR family, sensor histidine kinase DctS